ncbi:DUF397 domain-containing protein [Actinomadura sp. 9N407]|uniref:DUF397 domain-containing protein n=1 Tax=Actinomadura sp. 9N407 TaxID=3375154 RepID=UPI0037A8A649
MWHSHALAHSFPERRQAVEPLRYRKSSRCEELNQDGCVEIANGPDFIAVRDSTAKDGPVILVGRNVWRRFVATLGNVDGR